LKKLLISGDTEIACCVLEDNGSIQRLKAESILRATFCVPQKDGVFTVFEGNDASSFVRLDRELREIDRLEISGAALCHLWYCEQTKTLYGSCYGNGQVVALSVGHSSFGAVRTDRMIGLGEPGTPRAHCCVLSPNGRFLLTAAIDQNRIYVSRVAADGSFAPNDEAPFCQLPQGSGPRHLKFHPGGRTVYAVTEYSNEIFVLDYVPESGAMRLKQAVSTLPQGYQGESFGSALLITRDGKRLYAANRGADTIALFFAALDGTLIQTAQYPCGGHWPRHLEFTKDETMILAANERSCSVTLHTVDAETGALRIQTQIPFDRPGFAAEWDEF
jgi:6-phosphogluconolactonase